MLFRSKENTTFKPEHARFKLVIWYKDGRTRYYYSFDNKTYKNKRFSDEYEGLMKLVRLVHTKKDSYKNAYIYANLDENKAVLGNYNCQVIKWNIYGQMAQNKYANFKTVEKNVIFDFERIKYLEKLKI